MSTPRVLFAPASGPGGSGEYYRCLALARAMVELDADIEIEFMLHRGARVERDERFLVHEIEHTPARAGDEVVDLLERRRPSLAVFDCTGRVAQFRAARRLGARVVWIGDRPRQRIRGFRPRQMRWMNLQVIVDSFSQAPTLRAYERLLLRFFPEVGIELVRAVVPRPDEAALGAWRETLPEAGRFALFVAGGGGYRQGGRPVPELFLDAAEAYRRQTGEAAVVVMGPQYRGEVGVGREVLVIPSLPTAALGALLERARMAVIGAGNMLSSQALAAGIPLVVTAAGGSDQPRRVRRLARSGGAIAARPDSAALASAAVEVLQEMKAKPRDGRAPTLSDDTLRVARRLLSLAR